MTDEYRDVPNGYVYLYEREGWVVVERGDLTTRIRRGAGIAIADHARSCIRAAYAISME